MTGGELAFVSPTSAELLRLCFLRVWYSRQGTGAHSVSGPDARLGMVAHALLAAAGLQKFNGATPEEFAQEFDDAWSSEVARQQEQMDREGEARFGELAHWRSYETTRALTKRAAFQVATTEGVQVVEQEFSSPDGLVRGWPDRIVVARAVATIEDFKTGSIFESDADAGDRLKPAYERQVLIYAGLVGDKVGSPPELGRVVGLDGHVVEFVMNPHAAASAVQEARDLLRAYNEKVRAAGRPEELAAPEERACSYCPHQTICEPYWVAASPTWTSHVSIEGVVDARQDVKNGTVAVRLDVQRGTVPFGQRVVVAGLNPAWHDTDRASKGRVIRVAKVQRRGGSYAAGWYTSTRVF